MRRRDYYWSLFHKDEKRQIDDLKTDYIEVVFEVMPKASHGEWLIWREGFRSWKPLADFPSLLMSLREHKVSSPQPQSPAKPSEQKTTTAAEPRTSVMTRLQRAGGENAEADFAISNEAGFDDRETRYPKKWEIRIFTGGGKSMVSQSIDISNHGIYIKDALPRGLQNYFNVEIKAIDQIIPVICSEVKTPDGSASQRLRIEVNHHENLLQTLLLR